MKIKIAKGSQEAVYAQIAGQIRAMIGSGALPPGSMLASVRSVGGYLGVNLNTVARAYRLLEKERFVTIERRKGVRVAAPAPTADAITARRLRLRFRDALHHLRQAGVRADEIHRMVFRELESKLEGNARED
jgi:GntR family transcriptional regulator